MRAIIMLRSNEWNKIANLAMLAVDTELKF
jgi:hypothetical protein